MVSLEEAGLPLIKSVAIINEVIKKINDIPGAKGKIFKEKLDQVLKKNSIFMVLQDIAKIQAGESGSLPTGWNPAEVAGLNYCPIASVDAERSFSVFKHIFNNRRQSFTEDNLEKVVISNCFYAKKQ